MIVNLLNNAHEDVENNQEKWVEIAAYCLMPNHIHLAVREKEKGGTSKFMLKLMTAYSMYFNAKYDRSGPLFTRPFRSSHIDSDAYLQWIFAYIHLNPLEMLQSDWKEHGVQDVSAAANAINKYKYSSYYDYFLGTRPESAILSKNILPFEMAEIRGIDSLLRIFAEHRR